MATEIDKIIGDNLRQCRKAAGLSQNDIAALLGVSHQQVQKYETAGNRISASTLWQIAKGLNLPIENFLPEQSAETRHNAAVRADLQLALNRLTPQQQSTLIAFLKVL